MPLFQQSVQKKFIKELDKAKVATAYQKLIAHFGNVHVQENIRKAKEEQYQEGFLRELFVEVLGYVLNPQPNYNLITEQKNEKNSKKADGAILKNDKPIAVIELKSIKTTDLQSIEIQAFNYKNNQTKCVYVITSNFQKLRFYIENAVDFEEFDLFDLSKERFELLYLCLQVDNVLSDLPLRIKQASLEREENITKKLYADYSLFKQTLFKDISINNRNIGESPITLFKKTQKLLDRFLFIFFAEDKGLLPPNAVLEILNQWEQLKELDAYQPLYNRFKLYFGYLNNGHKGKYYDIFAYNGGLFAPDDLLDKLKITDNILYNHCRVLSHYDFDTEVDTNILGHIFEHSLNEVDEVAANTEGVNLEKGKTKRKKDGIFYTPRYITKYIVESTIGELCKQQKITLGLDNEALIKADTKKDRKLYQAKINEYRNWLLQLTILDPACGSGAFLNQALEFLIQEHRLIDTMTAMLFGDSLIMTDNVTQILENNIFGVDINEESVEIARLALWLRTAKVGRKLNDLSRNIKVGNSLISDPSVAGDLAFDWHKAFPQVFRKVEKQAWHITCVMHNTRTSQRMIKYKVQKGKAEWLLPHEEVKLAEIIRDIAIADQLNIVNLNICADHLHFVLVATDEAEMTRIVGKIKSVSARQFNIWRGITIPAPTETMGHAPLPKAPLPHTPLPDAPLPNAPLHTPAPLPDAPLHFSTRGTTQHSLWAQKFNRKLITSYEQLSNTLTYIENNRIKHQLPENPELNNIVKSFVKDWDTAMTPQYEGGFDVVIGNPPYVFARGNINSLEKDYYAKEYVSTQYQVNTYMIFMEKSINLLKNNGYSGLIIPNSWLMISSAQKLRSFLLEKTSIERIVNLSGYSFEDANVETIILINSKSQKVDNSVIVAQNSNQDFILLHEKKQSTFLENATFEFNIFADDISLNITNKMFTDSEDLDIIASVKSGLKAYEVGKGNPKQTSEDVKNRIYDYKYKFDENTYPYLEGKDVNRYFLNWSGNYLQYGEQLAASRTFEIFNSPKIIIREITGIYPNSIIATYSKETMLFNMSNIVVLQRNKNYDLKYILCLLNSKLMSYYFLKNTPKSVRQMFPKIILVDLRKFPIKKLDKSAQEPFINLADMMLQLNAAFQKQTTRFIKLLQSSFSKLKVNKKIEAWYEMTFGEFRKELEKQKITIPIRELMDYQDLFDTNAQQIKDIQTKINNTEKAIDKLVYALYDLTNEEIQIIENQ